MSRSTETLIRAVAETLESTVLPALDPATSPAGSVRACLMLLATIEDRVRLERPALIACNARLRELLATVADGIEQPADTELRGIARAALARGHDGGTDVDIDELARRHDNYADAVTRLIRLSHSRRASYEEASYGALRATLSACAAAAAAPENAFSERAERMMPF